jgi:ATP-dependent RNA helicase DeaD
MKDQDPKHDGQPDQSGFGALDLSPTMMRALDAAGYTTPTPVQAGLIPRAMEGVDVMAQARTGTGKTAAFVIPILERLEVRKHNSGPQALVLVPTRELAVQVRGEVTKLSEGRKTRCVALYGGKPIRDQIEKLRRGADIIIGTPGRVLDHLGRGTLSLGELRTVVLDEADRMLDIGFRPDIERILKRCPESRQTLLLSATVPPPVARLAQRYMRSPESLDFSSRDITVETIDQFYFTVDGSQKFSLLLKLLERDRPQQAIIFCRTKRQTDRVFQSLKKRIANVACIHGDLAQRVRDRVMEQFRQGAVRYLVATDVVGRGIDVTGISHIINYDIPQFCDDYVHRVGRTGRMGRQGVAYTFVTPEEGNELTRIEVRINRLLQRDEMPGFHAVAVRPSPPAAAAEPHPAAPLPPRVLPAAALPVSTEAAPPIPLRKPPARPGRPVRRYRRAL